MKGWKVGTRKERKARKRGKREVRIRRKEEGKGEGGGNLWERRVEETGKRVEKKGRRESERRKGMREES